MRAISSHYSELGNEHLHSLKHCPRLLIPFIRVAEKGKLSTLRIDKLEKMV
jgi:hypothetical protein